MCDSTPSDPTELGSLSGHEYDEAITEAVVTSVAEVTGKSPLEMEPLSNVIDPDALNRIFNSASNKSASVTVAFDYCGKRVSVSADGVQLDSPSSLEE